MIGDKLQALRDYHLISFFIRKTCSFFFRLHLGMPTAPWKFIAPRGNMADRRLRLRQNMECIIPNGPAKTPFLKLSSSPLYQILNSTTLEYRKIVSKEIAKKWWLVNPIVFHFLWQRIDEYEFTRFGDLSRIAQLIYFLPRSIMSVKQARILKLYQICIKDRLYCETVWQKYILLSETKSIGDANQLISSMLCGPITPEIYDSIFESLINNAQDEKEIHRFLSQIPKEARTDRQTSLAILFHINSKNPDSAFEMYLKLSQVDYSLLHRIIRTVYNLDVLKRDHHKLLHRIREFTIKHNMHKTPGIITSLACIYEKHPKLRKLELKTSVDICPKYLSLSLLRYYARFQMGLETRSLQLATKAYLKITECEKMRFAPISKFHNMYLQYYLKESSSVLAFNMLERQVKLQLYIPTSIFEQFMDAYISIHDSFESVDHFSKDEMFFQMANSRGLQLSMEHYYSLIDWHCSNSEMIRVRQDLQWMISNAVKPNTKIYNRILKEYLAIRAPKMLRYLEPAPYHLPRDIKAAFWLLQEMTMLHIPFDDDTHALFIEALNSDLMMSIEWFALLVSMDVIPNVRVITHLLSCSVHNPAFSEIRKLLGTYGIGRTDEIDALIRRHEHKVFRVPVL